MRFHKQLDGWLADKSGARPDNHFRCEELFPNLFNHWFGIENKTDSTRAEFTSHLNSVAQIWLIFRVSVQGR